MRLSKLSITVLIPLLIAAFPLQASDIADAMESGDFSRVQELIREGVDVNEPQVDGATALHWASQWNDVQSARQLINAGAEVNATNRTDATPVQLAAINGSAEMLSILLEAGANPNTTVTFTQDTPLMLAAKTGIPAAVEVLIEYGADVNAKEIWGRTTPLMWAVAEGHAEVAAVLIDEGADLEARTIFVPPDTTRGFEGSPPRDRDENESGAVQHSSGELTPLHFAARNGHLEVTEQLLDAGADVNALVADGKDALGLAIFNGHYEIASLLLDRGSNTNQADARGFTPLFWAVDRRNMETAPNFPWVVTEDPLPLVEKLLDAGADPNLVINDTPRARMRGGSPRIVFATSIMRAAFSGDLELTKLLLAYGADPSIKSSANETTLSAAAGVGFIHGYHFQHPYSVRLEVIKLLIEDHGLDVNWHDDYGITALMVAGNLGDVPIIQYLIDQGADLGDFDLGKKNDGAFGASIEPLMPIDYAIGVGTFRPNNAIVINEPAVALMEMEMEARGIAHYTSECTLRGFTCSYVNMDPRAVTPMRIADARELQTGHQVESLTASTGLQVVEDVCLSVDLDFGTNEEDIPEFCQESVQSTLIPFIPRGDSQPD
jgi:ankyrin repeat protein